MKKYDWLKAAIALFDICYQCPICIFPLLATLYLFFAMGGFVAVGIGFLGLCVIVGIIAYILERDVSSKVEGTTLS